MLTIEARLRRELHKYAVELRKLAYTLPKGVGEHDLLRLSERMRAAAEATAEATADQLAAKKRPESGAGGTQTDDTSAAGQAN